MTHIDTTIHAPKRRTLKGVGPGFVIGLTVVAAMLVIAASAPLIAPHDPYLQNLNKILVPPIWDQAGDWSHLLGTDKFGRDYLSRLFYGGRISLLIAFLTAIISGMIGVTLGLVGGYFGGRADAVVLFLINTRLAMPIILIAIVAVSVLGASLLTISVAIGLLLWDRFATVVRIATQQQRALGYVLAARAMGASHLRIIVAEILPNVLNAVQIVIAIEMSHAIFIESALSFLGVGVQPPAFSWGLMLAEGKEYMFLFPHLIMLPGAAIFATIAGVNLFAESLRTPGVRILQP